ncbi:MAG: spore photoproduct lyase family protein [Candidatus Thorarchaeota archaeon]
MENIIREERQITANTLNQNEDFRPLKAHFAQYKMLSGRTERKLQRISSGSIVKRFEHTSFPEKPSDVVCPHFLELKWGYGCPYDCAWCFLKGTLRMLPEKTAPKTKSRIKVLRHVKSAIMQSDKPEMFNTGELCDSLMDERGNGSPFSQWIVKEFEKQSKHKVLFLTKSSYVSKLLQTKKHGQAVVSFSLNAYRVSRKWEKAPTPKSRLKAGQKLADRNWEVRVRIDPIVPITNWRKAYAELIDDLFSNYTPSRITLGTPRGLQSTLNNVKDKSWVTYLDSQNSGWGRKIADDEREAIYRFLLEKLENYISLKNVGLCKETLHMFSVLNLDFRKQVCNCIL